VTAARLWQRARERSDLAECLELFTALAAHRQQLARAVRLAAGAAALREAAGATPSPAEAQRHQAIVVTLRRAMDATRFTAAWHDGLAMSADEVVALALEQDLDRPPR